MSGELNKIPIAKIRINLSLNYNPVEPDTLLVKLIRSRVEFEPSLCHRKYNWSFNNSGSRINIVYFYTQHSVMFAMALKEMVIST